jgi:ABC-type glycerol-3-phosphate transport system substrate-binding protein
LNHGGQRLATGLAAVLMTALLSACGGMREAQGSAAQKVELNGLTYQVEQITASTWTARPPAGLANSAQQSVALVQAIEKASGCKVTDSSPGQQGTALNAQVDCGSRLKN